MSKRRNRHEEDHDQHGGGHAEAWAVPYGDMLTVLMALFIVLFAMSTTDEQKWGALQQGFWEGFGSPVQVLGEYSPSEAAGFVAPKPVSVLGDWEETPEEVEAKAEKRHNERVAAEAKREFNNLDEVRKKIDGALKRAGYEGAAQYEIDERGLHVSILTDKVLFDSARADLRPQGRKIIEALAPTLKSLPNTLAVEGHTNHLRLLPGSGFPSDWELSASRATSVVRHLVGMNVPKTRLSAAGFSDTRPLVDPKKPEAVERNRRVDIVVLSNASAEAKEKLAGIADLKQAKPLP